MNKKLVNTAISPGKVCPCQLSALPFLFFKLFSAGSRDRTDKNTTSIGRRCIRPNSPGDFAGLELQGDESDIDP
eukprot:766016-Hanusia_phi.AAC.3